MVRGVVLGRGGGSGRWVRAVGVVGFGVGVQGRV